MKLRHYVTLFDHNYLAKGLSLYSSLQKHSSKDFRLWVLPMDDETRWYLEGHLNVLSNMWLMDNGSVSQEFVQKTSGYTWPQKCWAMASEVTKSVMDNIHDVDDEVTYLDSDLYFFEDPEIAHQEIAGRHVAIVPHRFPAHDYERLRPSGLFNVSWVTFKTTTTAREILKWWNQQVMQRCDASTCGDQKYLDAWPGALGQDLCVFEHLGIGTGPWNAYTYDIQNGPKVNGQPLVFYHYHETKRLTNDIYTMTYYPTTVQQREYIYAPYLRALRYMQYHIDKEL